MGIESEYLNNGNITAYPNPANDIVAIKGAYEFINASIELYNMQGKPVQRYSMINGSSFSIQRKELPSGLYLLKILDSNAKVYTMKIIFE